MKLHISESLNQSDIGYEKTFSVAKNMATILVWDDRSGMVVDSVITVTGKFTSITELLLTITKDTKGELPIRLEDFVDIEFMKTSSRLRMDYVTESGESKALVVYLYENPCWLSKDSLKDYGIYLKG